MGIFARLSCSAFLMTAGCVTAGGIVRARHAAEFDCQAENIDVENIAPSTFRARGCGVQAIYVCAAACVRNSDPVVAQPSQTERNAPSSIERGNLNGHPALRAVLDDSPERVEVVAMGPDAVLFRVPGQCETASLLAHAAHPFDLEVVQPGLFRAPTQALADRVDASHSLILSVCGELRSFSALERRMLAQIVGQVPSLAAHLAPAPSEGGTDASITTSSLRAAIEERRSAILACVEQPSFAVRLQWDAQGAVTVSLTGSLAGSAQEECVRIAAGSLQAAAGSAPGELLHPISR
jgi:hypothetical protein